MNITDPKIDGSIGVITAIINFLCYWFHEFYPMITIIGALSGSFVAFVSAIRIIKGWINGKPDGVEYHHMDKH